MNKSIRVIKQDPHGKEMWRWEGVVIERGEGFVHLRAVFNATDGAAGHLPFREGDHIHEFYYADRWHNVFEVHDGDGPKIKGWYCNLSLPAEIGEEEIVWRDMALDLVVLPDGSQQELDWDEFEGLEISPELRQAALKAWDILRLGFQPPK